MWIISKLKKISSQNFMHTCTITYAFRHIAWFSLRFLMFREISLYVYFFIYSFTVHQALYVACNGVQWCNLDLHVYLWQYIIMYWSWCVRLFIVCKFCTYWYNVQLYYEWTCKNSQWMTRTVAVSLMLSCRLAGYHLKCPATVDINQHVTMVIL